jgi:hypothetical protein
MSVDKMSVDKMLVDKILVNKMSADKMSVDKMSLDSVSNGQIIEFCFFFVSALTRATPNVDESSVSVSG